MKLTQQKIDRGAFSGREAVLFDDDLPCFALRVRASGASSFIVQYKFGRQQRRMTLGSTRELTLTQARTAAKDVLAKVRLGQDPQGEKKASRSRPAGVTFKAAVDLFLARQRERLRPSSHKASAHALLVLCKPLHGALLDAVTRRDVAATLERVAQERGPVAADRAGAIISSLFSWAMRSGLADANPAIERVKHSDAKSRERVLKDHELAKVWLALPDNQFGSIVRLLMLTGCRRDEIGRLRWDEVDLEARKVTISDQRTKNKREHVVPLSDEALAILDGVERRDAPHVFGLRDGPFSGWSKAKAQLDAAVGKIEPWRVHDLRRSVATGMAGIGALPHVVEAALNHVSGTKAGVAGIYNRADYAPEKREALQAWASHLKVVVAQARGENVVRLKARPARHVRGAGS